MLLSYYSLNKRTIWVACIILVISTISITCIKINSMNSYYEKLNVPIPFYYFIGSTNATKKYIDLKIYNAIENKDSEGFANINAEPEKRVEYYYATDIINDSVAVIGSFIKNTKDTFNQINGGVIQTQKNIQDSAVEITDKLYGDFVKPKTHKMVN